ncbi:MAG: PAS domain S-box protein [Ignavibacteria bacterium]|nr:PAS domain S-box protein [Ignavibacteria bacterium]
MEDKKQKKLKEFTSFKSFEENIPTDKFIASGFLLSLIVLIIISILTFNQIEDYEENSKLFSHSQNVIARMEKIKAEVREAKLIFLDAMINKKKDFNTLFNNQYNIIKTDLDSLKKIVSDNPAQKKNVFLLDSIIFSRFKELKSIQEEYDLTKNPLLFNKLLVGSTETAITTDNYFLNALNIEKNLAAERKLISDSKSNTSKVAIIITSILGFIIIGFAIYISRKLLLAKDFANKELEKSYNELDKKVIQRTKELSEINDSLKKEINYRKIIEQDLIRSEARLKTLFDSELIGTIVSNFEGLIEETNSAFLKMTGYNKYDLPIKWIDMILKDELEEDIKKGELLKKNGFIEPYEKTLICKNGTLITVLIGTALLKEESEKFISFALDVSRKKQIEQELIKINSKLSMALKAGNAAEWDWDIVYNKLNWSEGMYELFDFNGNETINFDKWINLIFDKDKEKIKYEFEVAIDSNSDINSEFRIVTNENKIKWISLNGKISINDLNLPVRMVGICIDITERKVAENYLKLQNSISKILAESETIDEAMNQILENLCGTLDWDSGLFWFKNRNNDDLVLNNIFGKEKLIPNKELLNSLNVKNGEYISGEVLTNKNFYWANKFKYNFENTGLNIYYKNFATSFGIPVILKNKIIGIIECSNTSFIPYDKKREDLLISIGRQIGNFIEKKESEKLLIETNEMLEQKVEERTKNLIDEIQTRIEKEQEVKALYTELKETQNELIHNEKLAALGRFSSGIAHEIRNPLANISSLAQLLNKSKIDDKSKQHLEYILINIDIANKIIKDLLLFASPDNVNLKMGNINDILTDVKESVAARCKEKDINLIFNLEENLPEFELNEQKLYSAILNFVTNSIDAIEENSGKGKIEVSSSLTNKNNLKVIISDTGSGISPENLDKIFEPFFTTKDEGTGLGMGLAYSAIKAHRGKIEISSVVGEGTTIEIIFKLN